MDLQNTNPVEDLQGILTGPRDFFRSVLDPGQIDLWILIKSVGGAWFAYSLISWAAMPTHMVFSLAVFHTLVGTVLSGLSQKYAMMLQGADQQIEVLLSTGVPAIIGLTVLKGLLGPIFKVAALGIMSFGVMIMLPILGVKSTRSSYFQILVILAYSQWFSLFYLIPGVGKILAPVALLFVPLVALRAVFEISLFRSFIALLFFPMVMMGGMLLAIFFLAGFGLS